MRYGVAPDHPRIKGIITALRDVLDRGDIRIFGNVRFGEDITLDDLKQHYNAVIFATGADPRRRPGHPRHRHSRAPTAPPTSSAGSTATPTCPRTWPLDAASVAVIGNGNVALDVSRMLAKHADDLLPTEIPANVYAGLKASPVTDVHVFGRRGPTSVKFTPLELRELGELRDVDMVVYDEDFDYDDAVAGRDRQQQAGHRDRQGAAASGGQRRPTTPAARVAPPAPALLRQARSRSRDDADGRVGGVRLRAHRPDGQGGVVGTGEIREVPIQAVYRAVGYFGSPLPGVPFDKRHGVIPNHEGQVLCKSDSNERVSGVYATGWIKRGPVGLIGHTKSDAMETIRHLINDQGYWWSPEDTSEEAILGPARRARRARTPTSTAGTASTSTSSRSAPPRAAPASRSCPATRWCASRAASKRREPDECATEWVPDVLGAPFQQLTLPAGGGRRGRGRRDARAAATGRALTSWTNAARTTSTCSTCTAGRTTSSRPSLAEYGTDAAPASTRSTCASTAAASARADAGLRGRSSPPTTPTSRRR